VRDLRPGANGSDIKFFSLDGQLYFFANDGDGVKVYKGQAPVPDRIPDNREKQKRINHKRETHNGAACPPIQ
jgi:hypothetical protein